MTPRTPLLEKIIQPDKGDFSQAHAKYVLSLGFSSRQQARYGALAEKANEGTLSEKEKADLDEFVLTNALLTILKAKARRSLRRQKTAA
jgi:hypothetical protein